MVRIWPFFSLNNDDIYPDPAPTPTNHMQKLPKHLQESLIDFLQPNDALMLLLVNRSFKTILDNEGFWKCYSEKNGYENWSPTTIPWCKVALACASYNEGKERSIFKAARLGHPEAQILAMKSARNMNGKIEQGLDMLGAPDYD